MEIITRASQDGKRRNPPPAGGVSRAAAALEQAGRSVLRKVQRSPATLPVHA